MKFSESWLRTFVDPPLDSDALAHLLTMAGLEVEANDPVAPAFRGVVVGEVLGVEKHANADRLRVCRVDVGDAVLDIVCGAPNVAVGMKVPCARVGAVLPGIEISATKVRGVQSNGMLCSARELGLGEAHEGLLALPADAKVGLDIRTLLDLDDRLMTLKLTPNRSDCLGMLGLAREVAALTSVDAKLPAPTAVAPKVADAIPVRLEAGAACPRYCGRVVRGVDARAQTPDWMKRRLERSGVRPISVLVDITNYVMLELGQPLHAFDLARLQGSVRVRFARAGERLRLLNGRDVELHEGHLVIADDAAAVALAGVMGGEASGVSDDTVDLFLEGAHFAPETIALASRGLELPSDAAHRFERGVDFAIPAAAVERATALVLELCGGAPGPLADVRGDLPVRTPIRLRPQRANRVLGLDLSAREMAAMLGRLGLVVCATDGTIEATPPSFRFDLAIEEDLVEEIVRVYGFENVVPTLPVVGQRMLPLTETRADPYDLRRALAARDYHEVITFSFVDRDWEEDFGNVAQAPILANPIASQMSVMRTTLLGSLVDAVRFNAARRHERIRLFELAACFTAEADGYGQVERFAGVCCGPAFPEQWGVPSRDVDLFDVRADIEALVAPRPVRLEPAPHPAFHPGQSARVLVNGRPAGWLGALHPRLQQKYELARAVVAFEVDAAVFRERPLPTFAAVPRFLPIRRDLAFILNESVSAEAVAASLRASGESTLVEVALFDIYRGRGVPDGKKSLAFRVLLQDTEKTLTDAEVEEVVRRLSEIIKEEHKGELRS